MLNPAHQFHDKKRTARFCRAGVQDFRDVGMIHHSQRLALGLEPGDYFLGVHAQFDDFERHPPPHRLLLFGHIDNAAAAFADLLQKLVASNYRSQRLLRRTIL